jgi:hypothetical protein
MNARTELLEHIEGREVKHVHITVGEEWRGNCQVIAGTLHDVLPLLDFECNAGYGTQKLFGTIWYTDGTWSERGEYDGSVWWEYKKCPPIPAVEGVISGKDLR